MSLIGAALYAQSGGPTAVINASAYGVISEAMASPEITDVYAAAHGLVGMLEGRLYDMKAEDPAELALLPGTPSSVFGSCRYKLSKAEDDITDYNKLLELFQKCNIRYFFYNGGNDSMDTCDKISRFFASSGYECRVIGVPKTIDNDLMGTDHSPGFGSAAKYIATSVAEVALDNAVYNTANVTIIEAMGRHAGWLTGAAALAGLTGGAPDLIYLPEVVFNPDKFIGDVTGLLARQNKALVVVSEGVRLENGLFVSEAKPSPTDDFGHSQLGGTAARLAELVKNKTGVKTRPIELSLLQRCGAHLASKTDMDEAVAVGRHALRAAIAGDTGKMITIKRVSNKPYTAELVPQPVSLAANSESKVPREWITPEGTGVTDKFFEYALPLIAGEFRQRTEYGLPRFAKLRFVYKIFS